MADMNPETRTVDEEMDRSIRGESSKSNPSELLEPSGQRGVIGDRELHVEHPGQRAEEALGLAKRKVKDHADGQRSLDRDIGVPALTAGSATGRSSPGIECRIREPDGQVASALEAGLIFSPVPYPIPRLRVLVLAALRILHRVPTPDQGLRLTLKLDQEPCTNAA
jgi:hypothetical protein